MTAEKHEEFWNIISRTEEIDYDDELMNRLLRFKAVQHHLTDVHSILDIGAATGAFSIPLAKMGFSVVHLDLSEDMLHIAEEKAEKEKLTNIRFVKRNAADLSIFETNAFDLVLCFDGAVSFSGRSADDVIAEACRVGKKVMFSVSSKACMVATWLNYSMITLGHIHPSVRKMMTEGYFSKDDYDDAGNLTSISELKAYTPAEFKEILEKQRMNVIECRSIGSLTHLYLMHLYRQEEPNAVHEKINRLSMDDEFLELCDYYDKYVMPDGMGSFRRSGILAVAEKNTAEE